MSDVCLVWTLVAFALMVALGYVATMAFLVVSNV